MKQQHFLLIFILIFSSFANSNESISNQSDNDLKKYMSFEMNNPINLKEHYRYVKTLSRERRIGLARKLIHNDLGLIAYHGCYILISEGLESETIPVLAEIIASGKSHNELNDGLGWDWYHSFNDQTLFWRMMMRIFEFFLNNLNQYQGERQKNIIAFLEIWFPGKAQYSKKFLKSKIKEHEKQIKLIEKENSYKKE